MAGTRCGWNKYHAIKVKTEDGVFDSRKEYKEWIKLKKLQEQGLITDLQRQVEFVLIPTQYIDGKLAERRVVYIADFVYYNQGIMIVEDTKGVKTPEYVIKRKMMLQKYGIHITEV